METRTITMSMEQISKVVEGLRMLPQESSSTEMHTTAPHELIEMFLDTLANVDEDAIANFIA